MENHEYFYDATGFNMLEALADLIENAMQDAVRVGSDEWDQTLRDLPIDSLGQYNSVEFVQMKLEDILRSRFSDTTRIEQWRGLADQAVEDLHRLHQPRWKSM